MSDSKFTSKRFSWQVGCMAWHCGEAALREAMLPCFQMTVKLVLPHQCLQVPVRRVTKHPPNADDWRLHLTRAGYILLTL